MEIIFDFYCRDSQLVKGTFSAQSMSAKNIASDLGNITKCIVHNQTFYDDMRKLAAKL